MASGYSAMFTDYLSDIPIIELPGGVLQQNIYGNNSFMLHELNLVTMRYRGLP